MPIGSFLLTCSWLNLLSYFRQWPLLGIYIIMFTEVLKTVAKFMIILVIFIIAFGLGFHIMLSDSTTDADEPGPFNETLWSFMKTYVMMIGEFEYEGTINDLLRLIIWTKYILDLFKNRQDDQFVGYTAFLFVIFVVVMSIIIMNLLTGLAVDDIQSIAENAELKKLSMQVESLAHQLIHCIRFDLRLN